MAKALEELLARHQVVVTGDNDFQKRARLLQALWRGSQGLPAGDHRGKPLGSRLAMPKAKATLANYLTETIRTVVRAEVLDPARRGDKLYGEPRIFNDLLSSQPLCFNLFAELQQDLALATRALSAMTNGRVSRVTSIGFEHSPGRRDPKFTGDRSAFDVFVEYRTASDAPGFAGIEVKYHEDLSDPVAPHRERYSEIATAMAAFDPTRLDRLQKKPIQQIWRDHLLAGSLLADAASGYRDGFFAFLHPARNVACTTALAAYRECLSSSTTFTTWTLEDLCEAVQRAGGGPWIEAVRRRYLSFDAIPA